MKQFGRNLVNKNTKEKFHMGSQKTFYDYRMGVITQYDRRMSVVCSWSVPEGMQQHFTEGQELLEDDFKLIAIPNGSKACDHKLDHEDFMEQLDKMNAYAKMERLRNLMSPMYNFVTMLDDDNFSDEEVMEMYFGENKSLLSDTVKDMVKILKA